MRKVILALAVSLDGYIEGPNGEYDWCFTDQDYGMGDFLQGIDALFIGRKSYELMEQQIVDGVEGADSFSHLDQYIFSRSLQEVESPKILVSGDIVKEVNKFKAEEGKDIWLFGGASLTTVMLNARLVDEIWMAVHPILLGSGKYLFNDITGRINLSLLETKAYDTGLVNLKYRVIHG